MMVSFKVAAALIALAGLLGGAVIASAQSESDRTLEVPSRIVQPAPAPNQASGANEQNPNNADSNDESEGASAEEAHASAVSDAVPYLGLSVQYIVSEGFDGREVHGLEVVGVDPNSPAEEAGIRAQGTPTKLGASGATAGAMMPPLDLIVMPLLKRAGELGQTGDLIVAIDDNRVSSPDDLKTALETLKAGDVIYFTLVRAHRNAPPETLKLPVKLGAPRDASGNLVREAAKQH